MLSSIINFILAFLKAIPIVEKYLPPTSTEEQIDQGEAANQAEITKIQDTGRP